VLSLEFLEFLAGGISASSSARTYPPIYIQRERERERERERFQCLLELVHIHLYIHI
jgi:hypothetical protein